jgi:hypothetical protein
MSGSRGRPIIRPSSISPGERRPRRATVLQALLDPVADVEPRNNLGQHNTDVVAAQSPATFTFALRNGVTARRQFGFWTDSYELGPIGICTDDPEELRRRKAYHRDDHPLPAGWTVDISPPAPVLDPMEEIPVLVTVTPPSGWTGTQTVNVHTYYPTTPRHSAWPAASRSRSRGLRGG